MPVGTFRARWTRWLVRAAVSGVVIAILLAVIPLAAVVNALGRVSAWTWLVSVAIFFSGHYLNAVKLRLLLGEESGPHFSACVRAQYAGLVANLGLPGLAGGDLVRAVYLAPTFGLSRVTVASVADRIVDTATLLALILVALLVAGMPPRIAGVLQQVGLWVGVLLPLAVVAGLVTRWLVRKPVIAAKFAGLRSAFSARWASATPSSC